jgi:hypothetical protein
MLNPDGRNATRGAHDAWQNGPGQKWPFVFRNITQGYGAASVLDFSTYSMLDI